MARAFLLSSRLIERATLTGSASVLPVTNLKTAQPSKVWRYVSSGYVVINVSSLGGESIDADTLAMVNLNPKATQNWRFRAATSEANLTAAPVYDSGMVPTWVGASGSPFFEPLRRNYTAIMQFPLQSQSWYRVDVDGTVPYTDIGCLLLGKAVRPSINFGYGWEHGDEPADIVVPTPYGRTLMDPRDAPRMKSLPWEWLTEADAFALGGIGDMLRERATAKPFLVCLDYDVAAYRQDYTIYGVRVGPRRVANPEFEAYATTLQIRELL